MAPDIVSSRKLKGCGFEVNKVLGKGAFATVYECRDKNAPKKKFAAKVVETHGQIALKFQTENEIEILGELNSHRHIVRLHGVLRDDETIVQLLDYIPGCTFLKGILNWPRFTEQCLRSVLKQLLSAVAYCHTRKIIHRDICPENLMWYQIPTHKKPHCSPVIKLIDFNLSKKLPEQSKIIRADPLGNPSYLAPECMQEKSVVSLCSDVWSVGVIAFTLMEKGTSQNVDVKNQAGYPPFWNDNYNHLVTNICEANYIMAESLWKHISHDGKDFVKKQLCRDMDDRACADELLKHKYLQNTKCDEENKLFVGQTRLKGFLQAAYEKRNRNKQRKYTLTLTERKAFIPDSSMFDLQTGIDENNNNINNNEDRDDKSYYHW